MRGIIFVSSILALIAGTIRNILVHDTLSYGFIMCGIIGVLYLTFSTTSNSEVAK
jgi:hypothetical protein